MNFYKVTTAKERIELNDFEKRCRECADDIYHHFNGEIYAAIEDISEFSCNIAIAVKHDALQEDTIEKVVTYINEISVLNLNIKSAIEISLQLFCRMLRTAERKEFIESKNKVLEDMRVDCDCRFREYIVTAKTREEAEAMGMELLYDKTLLLEIDRIYQIYNKSGKIHHPVHYIIRSDNDDYKDIVECLISSLFENNRLMSMRYSEVELDEYSDHKRKDLDALYKLQQGGTIIMKVDCNSQCNSGIRRDDVCVEIIKSANVLNRYEQNVLTIFVMPTVCEKETETLYRNTSSMFVEVCPENASGDRARNYLKYRAEKAKIAPTDSLYAKVTEDKCFNIRELSEQYSTWYSHHIRTEMYPQYADIKKKKVSEADNRFGKALKDLDEMIGLSEVKKIIYNALDFYKVQRMYKQFGKKIESLSMHMVFTGNQGTAKTTVARLFAQILKDNDVITNGNLVEVGRADLIGKYVGHTAPLVKNAFNAAEGGVLFIDEAYSLLDGKDGMYGDEAINTIVQEMENRRNETIVIFAGYPKEMEDFLAKNPRLKSRIAFHVPFDDYSSDELLDIAKLMAKNKDNTLSPETIDKLKEIFNNVTKSDDYGNGRYVKNIMEKAELNRASRLARFDFNEVTKEMLENFAESDFEIECNTKPQKRNIGFMGDTI